LNRTEQLATDLQREPKRICGHEEHEPNKPCCVRS